ncbi:MAG: hypothetical protein H0V93_00445 [Euzebyales bacterium]|nr:hypothetical protein [Euzebyales bacterium]
MQALYMTPEIVQDAHRERVRRLRAGIARRGRASVRPSVAPESAAAGPVAADATIGDLDLVDRVDDPAELVAGRR